VLVIIMNRLILSKAKDKLCMQGNNIYIYIYIYSILTTVPEIAHGQNKLNIHA
jgi:hypothetical protein